METIFGILFVVTIFGTTNSLQLGWSSDNSVSRVKRFNQSDVDYFNSDRKMFEMESNIVMPNLIWDDALEKIAKEFPDDCNKWKHGSDYRIYPRVGEITSEILHTVSIDLAVLSAGYQDLPITDNQKAVLKKMDDYLNENSEHWIMYTLEKYNDKQTKVGCADTKCTGTLSPEVHKVFKALKPDLPAKYKKNGVCVFGPTNKFNPQIRKVKYEEHKRRGPIAKDDRDLNLAIAFAKVLLPSLPGGTSSQSKNGPEQSVPAQQQAAAPSSQASTLATAWISVVVLVLGFFL